MSIFRIFRSIFWQAVCLCKQVPVQVQPIDTREKGLVVAAGIRICVGPIVFVGLMLWEFKLSKKRM